MNDHRGVGAKLLTDSEHTAGWLVVEELKREIRNRTEKRSCGRMLDKLDKFKLKSGYKCG